MKRNLWFAVLIFVIVVVGTFLFSVFTSKWKLVFAIPAAMALMLVAFPLLAWISRQRFPIQTFAQTYYFTLLVIVGVLAYFQALTLWNSLSPLNLRAWVMGGIFVALGLVGNVMGKTRRNLAFGLRIPWSLVNERTWIMGSRRAGQTMVVVGVVGLVLTLIGIDAWILFCLIAATILVLNIYSLIAHWRMQHEKSVPPRPS